MRHFLLAADFDGTLAHQGRVSRSTVEVLQRLRDEVEDVERTGDFPPKQSCKVIVEKIRQRYKPAW